MKEITTADDTDFTVEKTDVLKGFPVKERFNRTKHTDHIEKAI